MPDPGVVKLGSIQQRVMTLADGRLTLTQVAARIGVKPASVGVAANALRGKGLQPIFARMQGQKAKTKPAKELTAALRGLPPHIAEWAANQIPADGTIADLVRGFIVDAYLEETGQ